MKRIPKKLPPVYFIGTYGNLTFYFRKGKYCVRTKSSITGKRVKNSPEYTLTMQYAERLGRASKIASKVYRQLPDGWKLHSLYRKLTGLGSQLLKDREYADVEIEIVLWQYLAAVGFKAAEHGIEHPMPVALQQAPKPLVKPILFPLPVLNTSITKLLLGKGSVLAERRKEQEKRFRIVNRRS
ncbi:MAG: hypothetical protein QM731_09875 [Chitinophagaceae bacterium]